MAPGYPGLIALSNRPDLMARLQSVMKDDAHRMTDAGSHATDAVSQIDAIRAARTLHGTMTDREDNGVALLEWHDFGTRLHARTLFGQHELAAGEVAARLRQQNRDLDREDVLAVEILVQAVVVVLMVLKHERRGTPLAGCVAALDEGFVRLRIARIGRHDLIPAVSDRYEAGIEGRAQRGNEPRKRVGEILILALPETMPAHDDPAPEKRFRIIKCRQGAASCRLKQCRNDGAPARIERRLDAVPVGGVEFGEYGGDRIDAGAIFEILSSRVISAAGRHAQACAPGSYCACPESAPRRAR